MTEFDPAPNIPPHRVQRMFAALVGGLSPEAIGAEENLPTKTVEQTVSDKLSDRWLAPAADFAKIQIARLENFCLQVMDRVDAGELAAIDRALRILDRLDRYHGFDRGKPAVERFDDDARAKLMAKINAAAANLDDAEDDRSDA